jgi:phosphoglycolate phosphatase
VPAHAALGRHGRVALRFVPVRRRPLLYVVPVRVVSCRVAPFRLPLPGSARPASAAVRTGVFPVFPVCGAVGRCDGLCDPESSRRDHVAGGKSAAGHNGAMPALTPRPPLTVGFDLDMTLIDSRPGIHATYQALSVETGVFIDADLAASRLGPPLDEELAVWFPDDRIAAMGDRYREIYPTHAITPTRALPGAHEAVAAVRALGGRALVVTAKHRPNAELHLAHLGIEPDVVVGRLWAEAKADALREHGAAVYVGDHVGDVRGAHAAGALSVAVLTGPCGEDDLRAAGADVLLPDLTAFPAWLRRYAGGYASGAPAAAPGAAAADGVAADLA